ncbi:RE1, partial [Symbiodinium sp. KB8]
LMLVRGEGCEVDAEVGVNFILMAAEELWRGGNGGAIDTGNPLQNPFTLGSTVRSPDLVFKDGLPAAQHAMGKIYMEGVLPQGKDMLSAAYWLKQAQLMLGNMLLNGEGIRRLWESSKGSVLVFAIGVLWKAASFTAILSGEASNTLVLVAELETSGWEIEFQVGSFAFKLAFEDGYDAQKIRCTWDGDAATITPTEIFSSFDLLPETGEQGDPGGQDRKRRDSDSDDSTRALEDLELWDKYDESLPEVLPSEVLGWLLLRRSGLGHQSSLAVQSAAGNSLKLEDIEKSLRSMEDELLNQELRPRHGLGPPGGKGRQRTYWVEEDGEWSMWMGDNRDLDEIFEVGEIHYVGKRLPAQVHPEVPPPSLQDDWTFYGSWWEPEPYQECNGEQDADAWWYDDLPMEQQKELEEAYVLADQKARSFIEARQAVKARNLSRGFYPFTPGNKGGAFKGKKSTSSTATPVLATSGSADEPHPGFLGAAVGEPGYTGCFICGSKHHDFRSCPKRQSKGSAKGQVHFASEMIFMSEECSPHLDEIYPVTEEQPNEAIYSQSSPDDLAGYAVLDSGATETVASLPALEVLLRVRGDKNASGGPPSFKVIEQPAKKFKFGNGECSQSSSYLLLPQQIGDQQVELGVYTLDVVGVPILIGIKTMMKLHAVVDFVHCRAVFAAIDPGLVVPLKKSRSGHLLVSLKDNWLSQGHRLDARTLQLDHLPLDAKEPSASSYVIQEVGGCSAGDAVAGSPLGAERVAESVEHEVNHAVKKQSDPLDEERMEGPDPRDPRCQGPPCYGNHKVAKAYKGSVTGSNQFAAWTGCETCKLRLSYAPRMGCHGIHRKSAPLAKDVESLYKDLPADTESYPSNREISLTAAENSALQRLEHLRRLRQGQPGAKEKGDKTSVIPQKNQDHPDKTSVIPQKNQDHPDKTSVIPQKNQVHPDKTSVIPQKNQDHPDNDLAISAVNQAPQSQGLSSQRSNPRGSGEDNLDSSRQPELFYTVLANADEVEAHAQHLRLQEHYGYEHMESIIELMIPRSSSPTRSLSSPERKRSFSLVFGLYAHGSYFGHTRDTRQYPQVCRYFNECLRRLTPEGPTSWTSFTILVNMKGAMHLDAHNLTHTSNLAIGLGSYTGGELWVERRDGDEFDVQAPLVRKEIPRGTRAPGQAMTTWHRPVKFSPKRYHQTLPWTGSRYAVVAYTARSLREAFQDQELMRDLRNLRFPVPPPPQPERLLYADEQDEPFEGNFLEFQETVTPADKEAILATYVNFEEGLNEIFSLYPSPTTTKVANLCTPWLKPLEAECTFQNADWTYAMLSHRDGCDLSTNAGFHQAQKRLQELQPEWLWCHVPQGPPVIFEKDEPWVDLRERTKARRYLKVIRHLLLLSRDHLARKGKLVWLAPSASRVWAVTEVNKFWRCHGQGSVTKPTEGVTLASNVEEVRDLSSSATPVRLWEDLIESTKAAATWFMNDEGELPIYPVDTSCLDTLTTTELEKLFNHVRQLHRRFGHPSNRLLVKNLFHRNADEKVIAAASKLESDECLESQIKLPSPAVNLDKCDKLWSCLQADGFHLRCGPKVYHFLLMVDEASGFAVIREMFSHPEEERRNMTGPEVVQVLQEAWFQYFGYPDTLKLDLEGALRSTVLREACLDKGVDLISAPAEYHETIADVEREIGYAALAAVTAHNSLGRVHGFSPLQWALGRDMSFGGHLHEAEGDVVSSTRTTSFDQQSSLRAEAEQAFFKHRAHQLASRARNAKVRTQVRFFPGDLVFFRRYKVPADLPANSWVDRPRLRGARWYGPARVLASETKVEVGSRKPSQVVWAISAGRLKKFRATQLRHASLGEKLTQEALRDVTMPWTMTSLTRLLDKGSYEDETRAKAARWPQLSRKKKGAPRRGLAPVVRPQPPEREPRADLPRLREPPLAPGGEQPGSDDEMLTDAEMRMRVKRHHPGDEDDRLDVERLLGDPSYLPRPAASSFQEQRHRHEQSDRPWHVQVGQLMYTEEEFNDGVYSVVLDMPANDKEWRKVLKDPKKFLAKSVQKGVEVSWNRLDDQQRRAMTEAKEAEVSSWLSNKVVKAALPHISSDQALKMRWIYTFKAAEPGKVKAKARMVILGFSDPSLLEQETSAPVMSRQSKMLFFNYAAAKQWRVLAGDVKTAFLQARAPDRKHPLFARPLPELSTAMGLLPEQMVELMGSAYGLTSAPREWFQDLTGTLRRLEAEPCVTDPCLWRLFSEDGKKVIALVGLYVDDILFCGDEGEERYSTFLHELHQAYSWSPWESDSFSHCGVRIQQFADGSILLDHSEFCSELMQMPSREKGDTSEMNPQEISQARAILGSAQWRASQTGPQHSAKVSYLLSLLSTKSCEVIEQVNKLIREIHSAKHVSVRVQQLNGDPSQLMFVGWTDAAVADRPDLSSTGGFLFGLMHPEEVRQGFGKVNPITWRSGRLHRVARSSLSAETQSLADLDGELMFARLTWGELLGHRVSLPEKDLTIREVPAIMGKDARALYDALERGDLTISNMKDKYSALETLALAQSIAQQVTSLQWTDSDHQLADGLTKLQKQDVIRKFLISGSFAVGSLDSGTLKALNLRQPVFGACQRYRLRI